MFRKTALLVYKSSQMELFKVITNKQELIKVQMHVFLKMVKNGLMWG